jgi:hypothetical protein
MAHLKEAAVAVDSSAAGACRKRRGCVAVMRRLSASTSTLSARQFAVPIEAWPAAYVLRNVGLATRAAGCPRSLAYW